MEKKGLCLTCMNDKECTFSRNYPVLQCEEFTDYEPEPTKAKKKKLEKRKSDKEPVAGEFVGE